jgi:RNA polymerase sigma factor (TIGR02999 family)
MEGHEITALLTRWGQGDRAALDELMPLVYAELKRIAGGYLLDEHSSPTLRATALVHEAYLRLVSYRQPKLENRKHFYVIAAQAVRRILVDHARNRNAQKRDGALLPPDGGVVVAPNVDILALHEALISLEEHDPDKVRIVELRYFAGLTVPEIADAIGMSPATVKRQWSVAKAWLYRALTDGPKS